MNKYITSSIFLAAGLSSLTATAQSNLGLKGSDTLFDLTNTVIANCGSNCAGLTYLGTGSGNGESAMAPGPTQQNIAPMSRFLNGGTSAKACNANGVTTTFANNATAVYSQTTVEQSACGLVIGLDGVAIVGSNYTAGSQGCDDIIYTPPLTYPPTTAGTRTFPGQQLGVGMAYDTNITWTQSNSPTYGFTPGTKLTAVHSYNGGTYTFSDWRDVLRIIYAGTDHSSNVDCESDVRNGIVQNWGNLFEDGNVSASNCNYNVGTSTFTPGCTQLRHAWRRDAESGTTDTFLALLGLPSVHRDAANLADNDAFCNSWRTNVVTSGQCHHPLPTCNTGTATFTLTDYAPDFRDQDPIRRTCASTNNGANGPTNVPTEQVCGRDGKLGLVLPIVATDFLTAAQVYPTPSVQGMCSSSANFAFGPAPASLNTKGGTATSLCPNGDIPVLGNQCLVPLAVGTDPNAANCMASKAVSPAGFSTCNIDNVGVGAADGRVYAEHIYQGNFASNATYVRDNSVGKRPIQGAFTRIHSTRSMNQAAASANLGTCQFLDATSQIGCLVQADECSIGFAGKEAINVVANGYNGVPTADPILLHGVEPSIANIQSFVYPMSRKLYLDTLIGFDNVWGQEAALAKSEVSLTGASTDLINQALTQWGFINIPGGTFCEDFNEQMLGCTTSANVNGCAAHSASVCASTTICGDGNRDVPYEDCDNGLANGTAGNNCTNTCRTATTFPSTLVCAP